MNKTDCQYERLSNITVGSVLLGLGLLSTLVGALIVPVIGLIFTVPIVVIGVIFLLSPRSKACSIIADKARGAVNR